MSKKEKFFERFEEINEQYKKYTITQYDNNKKIADKYYDLLQPLPFEYLKWFIQTYLVLYIKNNSRDRENIVQTIKNMSFFKTFKEFHFYQNIVRDLSMIFLKNAKKIYKPNTDLSKITSGYSPIKDKQKKARENKIRVYNKEFIQLDKDGNMFDLSIMKNVDKWKDLEFGDIKNNLVDNNTYASAIKWIMDNVYNKQDTEEYKRVFGKPKAKPPKKPKKEKPEKTKPKPAEEPEKTKPPKKEKPKPKPIADRKNEEKEREQMGQEDFDVPLKPDTYDKDIDEIVREKYTKSSYGYEIYIKYLKEYEYLIKPLSISYIRFVIKHIYILRDKGKTGIETFIKNISFFKSFEVFERYYSIYLNVETKATLTELKKIYDITDFSKIGVYGIRFVKVRDSDDDEPDSLDDNIYTNRFINLDKDGYMFDLSIMKNGDKWKNVVIKKEIEDLNNYFPNGFNFLNEYKWIMDNVYNKQNTEEYKRVFTLKKPKPIPERKKEEKEREQMGQEDIVIPNPIKAPENIEPVVEDIQTKIETLEKIGREKGAVHYNPNSKIALFSYVAVISKFNGECFPLYKQPLLGNSISITINTSPFETQILLNYKLRQAFGEALFKCINRNTPIICIYLILAFGNTLSQHANLLIYRPFERIIERFEPHGQMYGNSIKDDISINNQLKELFEEKLNEYTYGPVRYIPPSGICPYLTGFQTLESSLKGLKMEGDGFCVMWSLFTMEMILNNPTKTTPEIIEIVMEISKKQPQYLKSVIRGYVAGMEKVIDSLLRTINKQSFKYSDKFVNLDLDNKLIEDFLMKQLFKSEQIIYPKQEFKPLPDEIQTGVKKEVFDYLNSLKKYQLFDLISKITGKPNVISDKNPKDKVITFILINFKDEITLLMEALTIQKGFKA